MNIGTIGSTIVFVAGFMHDRDSDGGTAGWFGLYFLVSLGVSIFWFNDFAIGLWLVLIVPTIALPIVMIFSSWRELGLILALGSLWLNAYLIPYALTMPTLVSL